MVVAMAKTLTLDFPAIDVAALDVVTSLTAHNLAEGNTFTVTVPRHLIHALRDALEDSYPGVVNRVYRIKRDAS